MESLLLNFVEVAELIGFSRATIENWAHRRKPAPAGFPQPLKIGRILKYRRVDIARWVDDLGIPRNFPDSPLTSVVETVRRPRGRPRLVEGDAGLRDSWLVQ